MFNFYLPLAEQFEKLIKEYEIENWQAKNFYSKFEPCNEYSSVQFRQNVYSGIKILLKKGYLTAKCSTTHSKIFLYSETQKLSILRSGNSHKKKFIYEKNKLDKNLHFLSLQENFVNELIYKYPELTDVISKYKKDLKNYKIACNAKVSTLNDLIDFV